MWLFEGINILNMLGKYRKTQEISGSDRIAKHYN